MIRQTTIPLIRVGIMIAPVITFELQGKYFCRETDEFLQGRYTCRYIKGQIILQSDNTTYRQLTLTPIDDTACFHLHNVTIGMQFHWERQETQTFRGGLILSVENNRIRAINCIDTESYLESVISSEMSANASLELLKAHAVISRSWLMRPILQPEPLIIPADNRNEEYIRWYERDTHTTFHVCADDHCQRYQGITRATHPNVHQAVKATAGELLMYGDRICDARFSKSCGGVSELFESCWNDRHHPYLVPVRDAAASSLPDLTQEKNARKWIMSTPEAFCHTADKAVLSQILNGYDQETTDFYRWTVYYTQTELSDIIRRKSGIDIGILTDITPIERGASGRIIRLQLCGTRRSITVGKELEIRKWLSDTHLYSSAFVIDKEDDCFILHGAGWGHGVGLCQIGAAMMAHQGYDYQHILAHYFKNTTLQKAW